MDVEEFKTDIKAKSSKQVYSKYLLGNEVWFFTENFKDNPSTKYDTFKYYISNRLEIHFNNIAILGSAKTGFSLNEKKTFNKFNDQSDIDLVLVSSDLFNAFWKAYLYEHNSRVGIRGGKYKYVASGIFRKFITLEGFDSNNLFFSNWEKKTSGFQKDLQLMFKIRNDINYRIYESWEAVELYYIKGLENLKVRLEGISE